MQANARSLLRRTGAVVVALCAIAAVATLVVQNPLAGSAGQTGATDDAGSEGAEAPGRAEGATRLDRHALAALDGTYRVRIAQQVDAQGSQGIPEGEVVLEGAVVLRRHGDRPSREGWLVGQLQGVKVTGQPTLVRAFGATEAMQRPFAVRFDATGRAVERRFSPGTPLGVRNAVNAVVVAVQTVDREAPDKPGPDATKAPSVDDTDAWEVVEPDPAGTHRATYVAGEDGSLTKTWSLASGDERASLSGKGRMTAAYANGWLSRATIHYLAQLDATLVASMQQRYALTVDATLTRTAAAPPTAVDLTSLRTDAQLAPARRHTKPKPADVAIETLLAQSAAAQAKLDWQKRKAAMAQIAAQLSADPNRLTEVEARLWSPGLDGDGLRTLLEALVTAESAPAMAVLTKLIADKGAPRVARHSALSLLTSVYKPSAALLAAGRKVSLDSEDPLAPIATMALGGQVRVQGRRDPRLGAELRAAMMKRARPVLEAAAEAKGVGVGDGAPNGTGKTALTYQCEVWLRALQNMGGDGIWPLVEPFLVSQDALLRRVAIEATAEVNLPAARVALAKALQKDPDPHNRAKAASVAGKQPQWVFEKPVVRALREDTSPHVRIAAAQTVAVWTVTYPGLTKVLKQAVAAEKHADAKTIIAGLIHQRLAADGAPLRDDK